MSSPNIAVYKHATKGDYLLLRHAPLGPEGGASTAFGDFVHLSAEGMRTKGLDLILADFQEYPSRDPKHGSVVSGFTPEAKKASKLLKNYDQVSVWLTSESMLSLGAVSVTGRGRESGVVRKTDVEPVSLPCPNEAFFDKLLRAFEKCCYVANV
jgi:hypothetical protein